MGREPEHHNLSSLFTESMFCIFNDAGPFLFNEFEISGDSIYPDVKGLPFRTAFSMKELHVMSIVGDVFAH